MLKVKAVPHSVVLYLDSSTVLFFVYYYPLSDLESISSTGPFTKMIKAGNYYFGALTGDRGRAARPPGRIMPSSVSMAPSSAKGPNLLWFWIGSSDPFFILSDMTFCFDCFGFVFV